MFCWATLGLQKRHASVCHCIPRLKFFFYKWWFQRHRYYILITRDFFLFLTLHVELWWLKVGHGLVSHYPWTVWLRWQQHNLLWQLTYRLRFGTVTIEPTCNLPWVMLACARSHCRSSLKSKWTILSLRDEYRTLTKRVTHTASGTILVASKVYLTQMVHSWNLGFSKMTLIRSSILPTRPLDTSPTQNWYRALCSFTQTIRSAWSVQQN